MNDTLDTIRMLIAHDSQDDAEQLMNALRNAGRATRAELALNEDDLIRALKGAVWDIILCRPRFGDTDCKTLFSHLTRLEKDVPAIVLLDEFTEAAYEDMIQAGASNAVSHNNRPLLMKMIDQLLDHIKTRKALQHARIALHEAEKRLDVLMEQSQDAIAYVVDGMHIHANDAYLEFFGYEDVDDLAGIPVMDMVSADDHDALKKLLRARMQDENQTNELACKARKPDGTEVEATFVFSASSFDDEACTQIVIRTAGGNDAELQAKLNELNYTDQVTGLLNRKGLMEHLDKSLEKALQSGERTAVIYLQLDNFEEHQAALGIDGADELLRMIGSNLEKQAGDAPVARISGEDFAMLWPASDDDEARGIAEDLRADIEKLMPEIGARTITTTVSVGVAFITESSRNSEDTLTKALRCSNQARNQSKDSQGNAVYVHDPMDDVASGSTEAILLAVKSALENHQIKLLYQPVMVLEDQEKLLYEVYARIPQKSGEDLEPSTFMPVASEHNLSGKLDRWVILNSIKAATAEPRDIHLLINLSGYSLLDAELPAWIDKALKAAKLPAERVTFQVPESEADTYLKQASAFASSIQNLGCSFSINRFGCALDPFKLLGHVSASMVKFDGSFTKDLDNPESKEKFSQLIKQAEQKELEIMVGFVESAAQLQALWTMGVHYLQGNYLQAAAEAIVISED